MTATSVYEQWVRGLQAWAKDPMTNLDHLPSMTEESQPVAVFERLVERLSQALRTFTDSWADQLFVRLGDARDSFSQAQVMVDSQRMFARRLLLAQHRGLPQTLREALWDAAIADARSLQKELDDLAERADRQLGSTGEMTALFRDHTLTSLVEPGFPLAEFVAGRYADTHGYGRVEPTLDSSHALPVGLRGSTPRVLPTW